VNDKRWRRRNAKSTKQNKTQQKSLKDVTIPLASQAWGEQGNRKTMEDRHIEFPYMNELMGDEVNDLALIPTTLPTLTSITKEKGAPIFLVRSL